MANMVWKGQLTFGSVSFHVRLQKAARKDFTQICSRSETVFGASRRGLRRRSRAWALAADRTGTSGLLFSLPGVAWREIRGIGHRPVAGHI